LIVDHLLMSTVVRNHDQKVLYGANLERDPFTFGYRVVLYH
jgi:hypothetical protein